MEVQFKEGQMGSFRCILLHCNAGLGLTCTGWNIPDLPDRPSLGPERKGHKYSPRGTWAGTRSPEGRTISTDKRGRKPSLQTSSPAQKESGSSASGLQSHLSGRQEQFLQLVLAGHRSSSAPSRHSQPSGRHLEVVRLTSASTQLI